MDEYAGLNVYYGDLHNHCAISYGHGPLEAALGNARTQLDFCSVTGHAAWPDMPKPDGRIDYIIDFHKKGFARLEENWHDILKQLKQHNSPGEFLVFPGYEIHSSKDGDRTFLFKEFKGDLILKGDIPNTIQYLKEIYAEDALGFPHHIGYPQGHRGINWSSYDQSFCPLIEMFSMHGCAEGRETTWPYLHSMGPSDGHSSMQHGLALGHRFGLLANTDHHSAFPGSYGRGRTGLWAPELSRQDIWEALRTRRTYALTGDRIDLRFSINGNLMGTDAPPAKKRRIKIDVNAGGAISYIDLIKNNHLLKRFTPADNTFVPHSGDMRRAKLYLEVGWGEKHKTAPWEVDIKLGNARILSVEPRFRGMEVVSPVEMGENHLPYRNGAWELVDEGQCHFEVVSQGNPTNTTPTTQGMCLHIAFAPDAKIQTKLNDHTITLPIERLVQGAYGRPLSNIDSPAYLFHRLPQEQELHWKLTLEDGISEPHDFYYVRVVQDNGQMAWSSPIYF
ncbi:MAG: DUF3604 domain-containing protein [Chloroflexota bacterium]|jgi:hypothetical protein|nr:DUF3604 domain-containing protein [Chloroflexota bacterium]